MSNHFTTAPAIGLVGGMGSLATIETYSRLVRQLPEADRHVFIENLPMENVFDHLSDDTISRIRSTVNRLGRAGVRVVGIPCNTVHFYSAEIEQECQKVGIRFLSIIKKTTEFVVRQKKQSVAVLGTPTGAALYKKSLEAARIEAILPIEQHQLLINGVVRNILANPDRETLDNARVVLEEIGQSMLASGSELVVLGCTELPLAFQNTLPEKFVSTIDILVSGLVEEAEVWKNCA